MSRSFVVLALVAVTAVTADPPPGSGTSTYRVEQSLQVTDLPAGAKQVRVWFWVPEDRPEQKVLDLRVVSGPAAWRFERDPKYGRRFLYAESEGVPATLVTEFVVRRSEVKVELDPTRCGELTAEHKATLAEELRTDEKHMVVTDEIRKVADEVCGAERNLVVQAKKLFEYVVDKSDHYSLHGPSAKGKCLGSATECLIGSGDCCTDQHALFTALARARGIPTRLVFGSRLQDKNEGKDHDPGYRCWVLFFAPSYGWVPVECSAADSNPAKREFYFGGLDDRRLEFAEGRDHDLAPKQTGECPDLVIRAHVEVDGRPHASFKRNVKFTRQ